MQIIRDAAITTVYVVAMWFMTIGAISILEDFLGS